MALNVECDDAVNELQPLNAAQMVSARTASGRDAAALTATVNPVIEPL